MARKIVITSGKGGVGKTTATASIGYALAALKKKVLLCDLDFGLNNLDIVTGVEGEVVYDVCDVLEGKCRVRQAIIQDKNRSTLYILPSGNSLDNDDVSGQRIKLMLESVSNYFEYILIDCPAGLDTGFHRAVSCADEAIVVVTPNLSSIRDANKTISVLLSYELKCISVLVNRARGDLMVEQKMIYPDDIAKILNVGLLGVVPEEDAVFLSVGNSLPRFCDSFKAYKIIADNIVKNKNRAFDPLKKYSGFFGSIRRRIKRDI